MLSGISAAECRRVIPLPLSVVHCGGIALSLHGVGFDEIRLSWELQRFSGLDDQADVKVQVRWAKELRSMRANPAFDSGAVWKVFDIGSELVFDFASPLLGAGPYKRLYASKDFRQAELILSRQALRERHPIFPLEYPADELLFTNHLAHHALGVEVHGCGLVDSEGGGLLFLGHSGAGKSTTSRIWHAHRNPEVLSDDRIILRVHDGELWMYGTPWHGDAQFASPTKSRVNRIFILQHGPDNFTREMPRARSVGELFARSFPPFHSAKALANTVEFLNRVAELMPIYEFQFLPDFSSVEAALALND
jgi:hypothetical protein